jgi:predicted 2-oxoglutarate/Fe(II)-dependent dioxygenase YbiX
VLDALARNTTFFSAALPQRIYPPLFNRYAGDNRSASTSTTRCAMTAAAAAPNAMRTDLSATLFLSAPEDYDGGELVIEDTYGVQRVKSAGRRPRALPRHEPASGHAGHARRTRRLLLLDPEPACARMRNAA